MGFSTRCYRKFRTFWLANPESLDWRDFDNSNTPCSLGLSPPVSQIMVGICHMGFSLKLINVWLTRGLLGQSASELTDVALEFGTTHTSQYKVTYPYPILWSALRGSVMSDSMWRHGLQPAWDSPGKNTGGGGHSLLQGIFPTQGLNLHLLHCRQILYHCAKHKCYLGFARDRMIGHSQSLRFLSLLVVILERQWSIQ